MEEGGSGLGRRRPPPISSLSAFSYIPPRREGPAELSYFHRVAQVRGGRAGHRAVVLCGWVGGLAFPGCELQAEGEKVVKESVTGWCRRQINGCSVAAQ